MIFLLNVTVSSVSIVNTSYILVFIMSVGITIKLAWRNHRQEWRWKKTKSTRPTVLHGSYNLARGKPNKLLLVWIIMVVFVVPVIDYQVSTAVFLLALWLSLICILCDQWRWRRFGSYELMEGKPIDAMKYSPNPHAIRGRVPLGKAMPIYCKWVPLTFALRSGVVERARVRLVQPPPKLKL